MARMKKTSKDDPKPSVNVRDLKPQKNPKGGFSPVDGRSVKGSLPLQPPDGFKVK